VAKWRVGKRIYAAAEKHRGTGAGDGSGAFRRATGTVTSVIDKWAQFGTCRDGGHRQWTALNTAVTCVNE
jgi:hypothetical protein